MLEARRLELQSQMDAALAALSEAQRQAAQTQTVTVVVEGN